MLQIPTGEYCGKCPMQPDDTGYSDDCRYYVDTLLWNSTKGYSRLPQCLSDKPQVLTEAQRMDLISIGYNAERPEKLKEVKP